MGWSRADQLEGVGSNLHPAPPKDGLAGWRAGPSIFLNYFLSILINKYTAIIKQSIQYKLDSNIK